MILPGTVGELVKPLSWLMKVSGVTAAPQGFLIRLVVQPKPQSMASVMAAMVEGLLGSFVFYTIAAWIVLWLMARR
ncbi:MAG TPA: hypothetical protein VHZ52_10815 [Acidobacteriaceae bacterium]|jgi:hypothetical protein|nr:hypothetical protein [Acidobacteriaceae bacterium]